MEPRLALGLDFGTESVRALLIDVRTGAIAGQGSSRYLRGVIDRELAPGFGVLEHRITLPPDYALQHPQDWLDSAAAACRQMMTGAAVDTSAVIGIGVDFTSCTMLPALADGTPLCLTDRFRDVPLAWPRLWKHHGAKDEADRMTEIARERNEPWLARYGGTIGLEWFFPKVLEAVNRAPAVHEAADLWIEAGDWFVWQLVGGLFPKTLRTDIARSTCQAGYKALWNRATGYPSTDYFAAVHPRLADVAATKITGRLIAPGMQAGVLSDSAASMLGLRSGIPVSAAIIDAHAGMPGAGVASPDVMVLVLGTSACHMLNSRVERFVPGVAGVVEDGILPGFVGYETGQAAVGDSFAWLVDTFGLSHETMMQEAATLPPGSGGVLAIDWLNGCRTPLMDAHLSGGFLGITLSTRPEQLYRALMEATGFGLRWIVETIRDAGVPVERFVASGGLPARNPLLMQIYADILGAPVAEAASEQSVALGAAILGCLAAGPEATGHANAAEAISAMARQRTDVLHQPRAVERGRYDELYRMYRTLTDGGGTVAAIMRRLRDSGENRNG